MKSVIITGSSRGIGFETALTFARAGYKVYATMRNPQAATLLQDISNKENLSIRFRAMDVDSDASVDSCISDILKENGAIDVLVNNAGIERHGSIEELRMSDFKSVMETNYFGVLRCMKALLPTMRQNQSGCIINVASIAGRITNAPLSAYTASKFAGEAVTEALAGEVKPFNVRVAIVEPGIINTDMAQHISIPESSIYPHTRRFAAMFAGSLQHPTPASLVAGKILEIADSGTWILRHPVGPDALPFLEWRKGMTDEQWIDWNALNDEDWYTNFKNTFGMDLRAGAPEAAAIENVMA